MLSSLCSGWEFTESFSEEFLAFQGGAETVRLPHTVRPTVQNYALPAHYEMICGYRRELDIPADWADKRVFLQFDGAAHIAEVFVNGRKAAVPSMVLKVGDVVTVKDAAKSKDAANRSVEAATGAQLPQWIAFDAPTLRAEVLAVPTREQIAPIVDEQAIVELYSR